MSDRSSSRRERPHALPRYAMMDAWHPGIMLTYVAVIVLISCAVPSFALLGLGCIAGSFLLLQAEGPQAFRTLGAAVTLGCAVMLLAPLFDTAGSRALFAFFGRPYTIEALSRGLVTGLLVASMLVWFACLFRIVKADGILHVCGRIAPRIGMVSSLVMQMVPRLVRRTARVRSARIGAGLAPVGDGLGAKAHEAGMVFATVAAESLEQSVVCADGMESRGYDTGKRTSAMAEPLACDERLFILMAAALVIVFCGASLWQEAGGGEAAFITTLAAFGFGAFLPVLFNMGEDMRWRI